MKTINTEKTDSPPKLETIRLTHDSQQSTSHGVGKVMVNLYYFNNCTISLVMTEEDFLSRMGVS